MFGQRFALMCNEMPRTIRLRISEVVDERKCGSDQSNVFQYVRNGKIRHSIYQIWLNIQVSIRYYKPIIKKGTLRSSFFMSEL